MAALIPVHFRNPHPHYVEPPQPFFLLLFPFSFSFSFLFSFSFSFIYMGRECARRWSHSAAGPHHLNHTTLAELALDTMVHNFDMGAFYHKWISDLVQCS